ncbi:MAG: lysophospholipase [Solobacterium sp.]|nr:lysophospholipase [Solobacterium sp.]
MKGENIIIGEGTEYPLKGILALPDNTDEKVPAVVFVHGSGASNMDEQIYKLTPFKDLAIGLAAHGIASVRYDKRTYVHARKMRKTLVTVKEETIEDAVLAADLLRRDARIDPDRIWIVGHSMGAMLAPRIDAEGGNFRGMVLMAGTPLNLEDIVVRQLKQTGDSKNILLKAVVRLEDKIFSKKFDGLYEMPDEEAKKKKFAGGMTLYYFKEMGQKNAAEYLLETDKPALIMQGGMDFQVLPDVDFARFKELLGERKDTEFRLYPELSHLFVKGTTTDILKASNEYKKEQHIGPDVIGDIADFILRFN